MTEALTDLRSLDVEFLDALEALAAEPVSNWWQDVLKSNELFIAVRRNYLNVYFQGASIFKIEWKRKRIVPSTHAKYLVRQTQTYVPLIEGRFQHAAASLTWESYKGPETLGEMIRASKPLTIEEKVGLHPLIMGDPRVIDTEISLTRAEETGRPGQDRLDAAIVRGTPTGPEIVFCEAKHFTNGDLRPRGEKTPAVIDQIKRYEKTLALYASSLAQGYVEVAQALVRINGMKKLVRNGDAPKLHDATLRIAEGKAAPIIDVKPHLLIFGFDKAQRDDPAWRNYFDTLKSHLDGRLRAIGKPTRNDVMLR